MGLYKITDIVEADFGCEEHQDGPHAVLKLEDGNSVEVTEKWIAEQGIEEGKYIWLDEEKKASKAIRVVAAVIKHGNKIFATQRGYGEFKDKWEFPGGKIEADESPEAALAREIKEELDTDIEVGEHIITVDTDYPNFHIKMYVYWCTILNGELTLLEHEAAKWVELNDKIPTTVDWLPADLEVVFEMLKSK
ncbi:MAG: (deoxy)nucleoside triphosphate pyrophosphohydrolase [Eubacterium sp.]|nr:(deoxy)nucleoside triphosphate pyrophosphohydrolase [Eubacterium sp.]